MPDVVGNRLPAGSVIMCKLTPFVIMKDGDIDYVGGGKMEMVCWADDEYFEFFDQQVRELHMERSQAFITSVFRALTGSRHKTRRRQVTGISPTPVSIRLHTPATLSSCPTSKTLVEDTSHDEVVAKQLTTLEEDPSKEPNPNNDLAELYVAEDQQSSKHVLLICTDA